MTRIFDALRKIQAARPLEASPPPRPADPGPGYPAPPAMHPGRPHSPGRPAAPPATILALPVATDLEDDVLREMSTLRMTLEAALGERTPRVLTFASSQTGEGTTTIVTQFARVLAREEGLRVLLVDFNARRPRLDSEFAGDAATHAPTDPRMPHGQLALLPLDARYEAVGMVPPPEARALIESASAAYDWVLIDGPPILDAPDAATLAALSDGVVLVVQAGRTKKPVLARSADLLRKAGARVLGTVLNRRRMEIPDFIYRRI